MRKKLGISLISLLGFGMAGCVSTPQIQIPYTVEKMTDRAKVYLDSSAQIVLAQTVRGDKKTCLAIKDKLTFRVRSVKTEKFPELVTSCEVAGLQISTKSEMPKGLYMLDVSVEANDSFVDNPTISVRHPNPDFKSGPDQLPSGAKELAANQSLKGVVNYAGGMDTTWVKLKGKKSSVALTLLEEGENNQVVAQVYAFPSDAKSPVLIGPLPSKRKKEFKLSDDDLYVKVFGKELSGENKFSLVRRDVVPVKRVRVSVIDIYPVNEATSVALLRPSSALKVDSEVSIFGKRATGDLVAVGKCTVTSVGEGQVSCHLGQPKPANVFEYRGETQTGGQS